MTDGTARPIARALISVSDKTGLIAFAEGLAARGVEIVSTGGTAKALGDAGVAVVDVASLTGFPEIMDGRVKTLHPGVHGGLLATRGDGAHEAAMADHGLKPIDLLAVNLYPFEAALARGAGPEELIENIDVGGPAMIRAGAKNHTSVTVVVEPADYEAVLQEIAANEGATTRETRARLAAKAFGRTAAYDAEVSAWLASHAGLAAPDFVATGGRLKQALRYGENPHQAAGLYVGGPPRPGVATARQIQGKELGYNNIADADAALELVAEFDPEDNAAIAIIKHANPCGVAIAGNLADAHSKALACDPTSAFGGVVAVNRMLEREAARAIASVFTEVIIAPDADAEAREVLAAKTNLRLLLTGALPDPRTGAALMRSVAGGVLVQSRDGARIAAEDLAVVTRRQPSPAEIDDMLFAFTVAKHVKSNAIVYAKRGATVGVGAGQMSRVDSARIAAQKARDVALAAGEREPATQGSVVASDAFFPFADGLLAAAEAGATAVIQPGGAKRDDEVIAAADDAGLAMVFTGVRSFRH